MNAIKSLIVFTFSRKQLVSYACQRFSSSDRFIDLIENEETRTANLVLKKPPVNSLNLELFDQIRVALEDLEKRKFRGCIISSSSPSVFCAGLDIMELYQAKEERFRAFWRANQNMFKTLYNSPLITVAAINGHAPAAGCMLALSCDYRVMLSGKATIGLNETRLGIMAPKWFQRAFIDNIGFRVAEKALLTGHLFTPEEALSLGMIDKIVSTPEELTLATSNQLAALMKLPAHAYIATKMNLRGPLVEDIIRNQEKEIDEITKAIQSETVNKVLGKYMESLKSKGS